MGFLKIVVSSTSEAEFSSLFVNSTEASILWTTLTELCHPQLPIPVLVDNSMAVGLAMTQSNMNDPVLLTCGSTGFWIALIKAS